MFQSYMQHLEEFKNVLSNTKISIKNKQVHSFELGLDLIVEKLVQIREEKRNLYVIGNGGSAGIAAHAVTDFANVCKLKASTLHESSLLTCMANDYGYENALARMLDLVINPGDVLIAISSSGKSANIVNATAKAKSKGAYSITLTGFASSNPVREAGDLSIWVDSNDYGLIEVGHQFILHHISDRIGAELKERVHASEQSL
ncbi:MAG: SIS domain-containing protein [Gammaproteobacteria bacterium]|nr:SIS domain-containing protein [Gammaproteobacteria bacterium]